MGEVGIRALKQNASAVVARAAAGETIVVTDRGRPVAQLTPLPVSGLAALEAAGRIRPARGSLADLPLPAPARPGLPALSSVVLAMRDDERY